MIHVKLSDRRLADPDDPMERDWHGYSEHATLQQLFDNNRGRWVFGRRAEAEEYAVFSYTGDHRVKFVAEIEGFERFGNKRAIVGRVLPPSHEMARRWVGKDSPDRYRNPTTYHDDDEPRTCACGCGETVTAGRSFIAGHDQRAIHDRIERQWGGTRAFIRWFDATYGRPD